MGKSLEDRFNEKWMPEPNSGCWLWTASRGGKGYGQIRVDGKHVNSHRVSWTIHKGPIPEGLYVCHSCDTPPCVNPAHLFLGSQADNMADMAKKGRLVKGEAHKNAKMTEAKVRGVRLMLRQSGYTQCRIAEYYKVSDSQISRIKLGQSWVHVI